MKKIMYYLSVISTTAILHAEPPCALYNKYFYDTHFLANFTSGYVFKHDDAGFRSVYGYGMGNVLTGDLCYHSCNWWGIGAKISYWLALGKTTFFERHTFLQEVPVTVYVRKMFNLKHDIQLYASLGGGFAWIKDQSYLGTMSQIRGLGEVEAGLNYPVWRRLVLTGAFRYLFPRQKQGSTKIDIGGFDLRAGLGVTF